MRKTINFYILIILWLIPSLVLAQPAQTNLQAQQLLNKNRTSFFIENKGQWPAEVLYLARIGGMNAWITNKGVVYDYYQIIRNYKPEETIKLPLHEKDEFERKHTGIRGQVINIELENANTQANNVPSGMRETYYNYFIGNDSTKWASFVHLYDEVSLKEVYAGIEVRYYFDNGLVRYDYIAKPGADLTQIKLNIQGAEDYQINEQGELVLQTILGDITHGKLYAYQQTEKIKTEISCAFNLNQNGTIGILAENYNPALALVIDPLIYSTYIGGAADDVGNSIAIDSSGNTFVTGYTNSGNYPTTSGAYDVSQNINYDVFVSKLNTFGSALIYSTFIGGNGADRGNSIAINVDGNAFITGCADVNYPTTSGAFDMSWNWGYGDGFVTKLNETGSTLLYSTYIGGGGDDAGYSIALDGIGNAFITGSTNNGNSFPTTSGAYDTTFNGGYAGSTTGGDAFIIKLNTSGSALIYSTFFGGSNVEFSNSITIDTNGNAFIAGTTNSLNLPVTIGSYDTNYNGGYDVFVAKLNSSGSALVYSTYIGGGADDQAYAIAIDNSRNSIITGTTTSVNYPTTSGAYDTSFYYAGNYTDIILTKLNVSGTSIIYSTFIGNEGGECGRSITIDTIGNALITGNFGLGHYPTTQGAYKETYYGGYYDVFITKMNASGSSLLYSSCIASGTGYSIALDNNGNVYVTGRTGNIYPTIQGSYDLSYNGGECDAFVTKLLPINQAINVSFSNFTSSSLKCSWIKGGGNKRAVFIKKSLNGVVFPLNGTTYLANDTFSKGSQIGSTGWYCVYNDTGSIVTIKGLSPNTPYKVMVYDYNNVPGNKFYNTDSVTNNPRNCLTLYATPSQASNINFNNISGTTFTVNCKKGNGTRRAFFIKSGNSGKAIPVNNITYSPNSAFGYGTQIGSTGWYCIYNDTGSSVNVTNLSSNSTYRVMVCEYNGVADSQQYNIDSTLGNPANQLSDYAIPTVQSSNLVLSGITTTSFNVYWSNGDGTKRVVFLKSGNSGSAIPTKHITYTPNDTFGKGSLLGSTGWYCIYNGTGSSCNVSGLTANTIYRVMVCEYHGTPGRESYNTNIASNNPMNYDAIPATQAQSITFSSYAANSYTASWTNGNGTTRAVFVALGNSGTATPSNNITYSPSGNFGSGTQIGNTGWYCVYNGTGNSTGISGLIPNTTYRIMVCEYNGLPSREQYNIFTATNNPRNYYPIPTTQAYDINYSTISSTYINFSWASGNGAKRAVFILQGNAGIVSPSNYTTYTPNIVFGSGSQVGSSGWYCVYDGTGTSVSVTGLSGNTTYRIMVCEYNGVAGEEVYNIGNATNNPSNQTTDYAVPDSQTKNISFTNVTSTGFDVSWSRGNGSSTAIFISQGVGGYVSPIVNTSYIASSTYGSGSQVGSSGWFCIYNSNDTSVTVRGLSPNTTYRIMACEYNGTTGKEKYNTNNAYNNPINQTTDYAVPNTQAYNISFSKVTDSSFSVNWTNGNGSARVVFIKSGNTGSAVPSNNTSYTSNEKFGSGTQIGTTGWYCIYNGSGTQVSVIGLSPTNNYRLMVCEYNGTSGLEKYNTNSATVNPNNQITDYAVPSTQASNISFNSITSASFDGTWTNGNGTARIVFIKAASSGTPMPVNNSTYSANSAYGSGSQIGASGWYCIYDGTGDSVSISNLTPNTTYRLMVCEYNGISGSEKYSRATLTNNPANQTTDYAIPTSQASSISFSTISDSSFFASWTNGNGSSRAVFLKAGTTGIAAPIINTSYTADSKFKAGSQISTSGWYCVYNGSGPSVTITGLTANTTYRIMVCDYNGTAGLEKYNTNTGSNNPANQTTDYLAPDIQASGIIASNIISTNFNIDWKKGNGSKCAVFIKSATTGTATPDNNTNYIPNPYFGTGSQIRNTGWYCIYNGFDTFTSVSGLTQNTNYRIMICEYNGTIGSEKYNYNTSTNNPLNVLTDFSPPTVQAYSLQVIENNSNSIKINWTKGNGSKGIGFIKTTVSGNAMPVNNTGYVADSVYKSGSQIGSSGWYCFYNGTGNEASIHGLSANKNYRIMICEYNGTSGKEKYRTDASSDNPLNNLTLPTSFNLSGGGEYCSDISLTSINIRLDSSETGVSYQLLKNTAPLGTPINGNNNPYTWNNLTKGIYTVEAINTSGSILMNGNIVVIENPLPEPEIIGLDNEYCLEFPAATLTGIPAGGTFSGKGISGADFTPTLAGTGKHKIYYTFTDIKGCKNTDSNEVSVHKLEVEVKALSVSCGQPALLDAIVTYTGTADSFTYKWLPEEGLDHPNVKSPVAHVSAPLTYEVSVSSHIGCKASDTGRVSIVPLPSPEICVVTIDTVTWKNKVIWTKPLEKGPIDGFNIYKETKYNVYELITTVPYENSPQIIDMNSMPEKVGEKYKVSIKDTCGLESKLSYFHKTINLTLSAYGSTMGLNWDNYEDESGKYVPPMYYIYRGTTPSNLHLYDSVSGSFNSYNDVNIFSVYYYMVGVIRESCNDTGGEATKIYAFSNKKDNRDIIPRPGIQASDIQFYNITSGSVSYDFTKGDGYARVVLLNDNDTASPPVLNDNVTYSDTSQFGSTNWKCIYNGKENSGEIKGLSPGIYQIMVYEYNGTPGFEKYNTQKAYKNPNSISLVSVQENENFGLLIYPNPFKESTTVRLEENFAKQGYSYTLYDCTGKALIQKSDQSASEFTLEKGELTRGIYFIEINGATKLRGKVMIVE